MNFAELIPSEISRNTIYQEEGYHLWDPSIFRDADGIYHLTYSRWKSSLGFDAWCTHAEIAWATSASPEGPYKFQAVILPARGAAYWDGHSTYNGHLISHEGRLYLYYTGNHGDENWQPDSAPDAASEDWWLQRNRQRIGVAVADSMQGPWQRFEHPLLDVGRDTGSTIINVPVMVTKPDGGFRLYYKTLAEGSGRHGGGVFHYGADSASPLGPFVRHPRPMVNKNLLIPEADHHFDFHIDDHFECFQNDRYYAIVKDHDAPFLTRHGRSLLLFESSDGRSWAPSQHPLVQGFELKWENGARQKFARLEMPKLLLENSRPSLLSLAALPAAGGDSFLLNIPLNNQ